MHTPGHALINVAALGTALDPSLAGPIIAGAVLPDLPIMALYLRERVLRGTPEEQIWSDHYQRPFWNYLIHVAHSAPLAALGIAVAAALGALPAGAFFASILLHSISDFPVHAKDAHRHLLPFSHFRWESPLSYWDPRYHGKAVAFVEMGIVFMASTVLWSWDLPDWARIAVMVADAWYVWNYARSFLSRARAATRDR
jgi:hypothetical protein